MSETLRAAPTQSAKQPTNQTNKTRKKKNNDRAEAREERDRRRGTHKEKMGGREGGEALYKGYGASSKLPSTKG